MLSLTLKYTVDGKGVLFLTSGLALHVGDARREVLSVGLLTLALAVFDSALQELELTGRAVERSACSRSRADDDGTRGRGLGPGFWMTLHKRCRARCARERE